MLRYGDFPHIIEAIVELTSWWTQLNLRLVCRSFCHAVDRHHVFHVVLSPHRQDPTAAAVQHRDTARPIPGLSAIGPLSWSQLPAHPKLALAAHTRVLDVRGKFPATCNLHLLRSAFPNLHTFRLCTNRTALEYIHDIPFDAKTHVLFADRMGPANLLYGIMDGVEANNETYMMEGVKYEGGSCPSKIVVNMHGDYLPFEGAEYPPADEVVFTVSGYEGPTLGEPEEEDTFAWNIAKAIKPGIKYTIVGLENIEPGFADVFRPSLHRQLCEVNNPPLDDCMDPEDREEGPKDLPGLLKAVNAMLEIGRTRADNLMKQVEMVGGETYWNRVGGEVAVLDMVEYFEDLWHRQYGLPVIIK